ncbi:uncharacterized protein LOC122073507 [Macadamia integrifolia]|uniref:uncharacterized protein LOC122073507 n=1 Tax=Macadamia integrifolia TaxID=60698 RepID=UPI001C4E7AC1|nr:uncharacterized protein LOC122073507 [Macadamia integrifolia]
MQRGKGTNAKMKKKVVEDSSPDFEISPLALQLSGDCAKHFGFNLQSFQSKKRSKKKTAAPRSATVQLNGSPQKILTDVSHVKNLAFSRADAIKRELDLYNLEILKEIGASHSRLSKRFKTQIEACQQLMDESEKEFKKMCDWISETMEAMKASFEELITEAQGTASYDHEECKPKHLKESIKGVKQDSVNQKSIPDLKKSLEKAIEALRSGYSIT